MAVNIYAAQEAIMLSPESAEVLFFIFVISFLFCMFNIKSLKARQHGQIGIFLSRHKAFAATALTEFQQSLLFCKVLTTALSYVRTNLGGIATA